VVGGRNFACGSSREAAVWALHDHGIRAAIAPSFGDIFYNNGLKNGLLPVVLPADVVNDLMVQLEARPGATVAIDLPAQTVTAPDGGVHAFEIDPFAKHCLLEGGGRARLHPGPRGRDRGFRAPLRPGEHAVRIAVLPRDGIGPEVTAQAVKVLRAVSANGAQFEMVEAPIGDAAFHAAGDPLPPATLEAARRADAILFGAAGTYECDLRPPESRGGHGLLRLRKALDLFANFRPVFAYPELLGASTLRREVVEGVDLVVLRELTGDIYFGTPRGVSRDADGQRVGTNTMRYTEAEIARVAHAGFRAARGDAGKLCSVDKANVLETSLLWREVGGRGRPRLPGGRAAARIRGRGGDAPDPPAPRLRRHRHRATSSATSSPMRRRC
jgi:hypothetical protein